MSERYAVVEAEKASFPIARGCKLLEVSASGSFAWSGRPLPPAALRRGRLAVDVAAAHGASDGISATGASTASSSRPARLCRRAWCVD